MSCLILHSAIVLVSIWISPLFLDNLFTIVPITWLGLHGFPFANHDDFSTAMSFFVSKWAFIRATILQCLYTMAMLLTLRELATISCAIRDQKFTIAVAFRVLPFTAVETSLIIPAATLAFSDTILNLANENASVSKKQKT